MWVPYPSRMMHDRGYVCVDLDFAKSSSTTRSTKNNCARNWSQLTPKSEIMGGRETKKEGRKPGCAHSTKKEKTMLPSITTSTTSKTSNNNTNNCNNYETTYKNLLQDLRKSVCLIFSTRHQQRSRAVLLLFQDLQDNFLHPSSVLFSLFLKHLFQSRHGVELSGFEPYWSSGIQCQAISRSFPT